MESDKRILCLDDSALLQVLYHRTFRDIAQVVMVKDGAAGLEKLKADPEGYGLIVTDNEMSPGMCGLDFLRAAREYRIPKVMVATPPAGMPDKELHDAAIAEGSLGLIVKPYEPALLQAIATELLRNGTSPTYDTYVAEHGF